MVLYFYEFSTIFFPIYYLNLMLAIIVSLPSLPKSVQLQINLNNEQLYK